MTVSEFLKMRNVPFDLIEHVDAYDAQHLAQAVHVSGREVAKTVLLRNEDHDRYVVAVVPADKAVNVHRASQLLGQGLLEVATEIEITKQCPDCEMGVLPPFGSQYGMKTIVDADLSESDEIVFEANTHHEAVRMRFDDFCNLEKPIVGSFTL